MTMVRQVRDRFRFDKDPVQLTARGHVEIFTGTVTPTNGDTAGTSTGYDFAGKGALYIDSSGGKLYINTGTGPNYVTWTVVGNQS